MENFELLETTGGKWVKVKKGFNGGTMTIEMSNILLNINISSKMISFGIKNEEDIYDYLGDISFDMVDGNLMSFIFSPSIKEITFNTNDAKVDNRFSAISDLKVQYSFDNIEMWHKNR